MNENRISQAASTISKRKIALKWLEEYGINIDGRNNAVKLTINIINASGCIGAKEAEDVLISYATLNLPDVVQSAISCCKNDIAMAIVTIREEINDP